MNIERAVVKYDKKPPHLQVSEYKIGCTPDEMRYLFDVDSLDQDMIYCYDINTPEQVEFFRKQGVLIDLEEGHWFLECYQV
jgi:hypothetical protein